MGKPSNTKDTSKQNKKVWPSIKLSDLHKRSASHLSMGERWRSRRNWPPNFKSRWSPSLLKVNKDNRVSQIRFPGTTLGTRCSLNSCSLAMLVKADVQTRAKPGVYFTTLKLVCRASNFFFPSRKQQKSPYLPGLKQLYVNECSSALTSRTQAHNPLYISQVAVLSICLELQRCQANNHNYCFSLGFLAKFLFPAQRHAIKKLFCTCICLLLHLFHLLVTADTW